jgi:hypothetical protein
VGGGKIETPIHENEVRREWKIFHFILAAESLCLATYRKKLIYGKFIINYCILSTLVPILVDFLIAGC